MEAGNRSDDVEQIAARLAQLELTLLEVVTALGMLVGELALREDLVLTTPGAVEEALEHGWQALVGVPAAPAEPAWSGPDRLGELAPTALRRAMEETGAAVGAVYTVGGATLELVASEGYPEGVMDDFRRLALDDDLPAAAVARTGRPLWFGERAEIVETYPHLLEAHELTEEAIGDEGAQGAVVPLLDGGRVVAVVLVGFARSGASPDPARLASVRERVVQALDRR